MPKRPATPRSRLGGWRPTRRRPAGAPTNCGSTSTRTPSAARRKSSSSSRAASTEGGLAVYPEYVEARRISPDFFSVAEAEMLITNGTDEAIQVIINTYVDDGDDVIILRPSYAMYTFYAEVAGAQIRDIDYRAGTWRSRSRNCSQAIRPDTRAMLISNPNNPTGTRVKLDGIERILKRAPDAAVLIDEAYFEFCGITALRAARRVSEPLRQPHVFEGVRHGRDAPRLPVLRRRATSRICTRRSRRTA